MSRSRLFWILVCIAVVGIALRSYDISARSLWFDEAFSWRLIQFPFWEMIARDAADVHPPLYYMLLQGWSVIFGNSLLALRSFSVACAGISLFAAYVYAAYAFRSQRAGLYAAAFLAVSPWAASYAWEARMYPLGMIFALLSSYALLHGLRDKSLRWFCAYGIFAALLIYTHYYGFFTIITQLIFGIGVLVQRTKWRVGEMLHAKIFWGALLAGATCLLLFSPWIPTFLQQRSQVQESYWVPPLALSSVPDTLYHFFLPTVKGVPHHGPILLVSLMPLLGVLLLWAYVLIRYRKSNGVYLTFFLSSVPILVSVLVSLVGRSLYNDRFFAFTGIFIFILLAYVVSAIQKPIVRRICGIGVGALLLLAYATYWNELDIAHKGGAHAAAKYIFENRTSNESVLVSSPYVYFAILYYATEEFHAKEVPHLYSKTGELSHFSGGPIMIAEDIVGSKDIAKYAGTVWVVDTTGFTEQPFAQPANWQEKERKVFPEVFVHQGDVIIRKFQIHL